MPPPGCTLPPQKYSPRYLRLRFGCLKNAAMEVFEEIP
jgi:hypothetical protein